MTRYIDADAYLKKVCAYKQTGCGSCPLQTTCPADEPTIDAEPVRHGKWVFNPSDALEAMFAKPKCSECGFESADGGNYCSNCGARMDEE